jgi:N-acetylmuramoyl-L-alanine amidase
MTIYELLTDPVIKSEGLKNYHEHQNFYVLRSSIISGIIAGFVTNPLEVIVLRKQTQSGQSISELLKTEGFSLLTKGL